MSKPPQFDPSIGQKHIIERPRLLKLLEETEAKIILLVAPAGYGKTTLARQWAARHSHSWYRVTSAARDPAVLAMGLLAAMRGGFGNVKGTRLAGRLSAPNAPAPSPGLLANLLFADISAAQAEWLVLDDLHVLDEAQGAQDFMAEVVDRLPSRQLLTARRRPPWATSRRVIYGEIFEVDATTLAMSPVEAAQVLNVQGHPSPDLLSRAAGWPALIGLAATRQMTRLPKEAAPRRLYDFMARELHIAASSDLRGKLLTLAVAERVSTDGDALLSVSSGVVAEAIGLGILVPISRDVCEMHPLMREYILATVSERESLLEACSIVFGVALSADDWETALSAVRLANDADLLADLIEAGMDYMVRSCRLETLRAWAGHARQIGCDAPIASLLRAELSFRDGRYSESALEAEIAARGFTKPKRRHQALSAVARAEYFADNNERAIEGYRLALEAATTPRESAEALRGIVLAGVALDERELDRYWEHYSHLPPTDAAEAVRRAAAELHVAYFRGGLHEALESASRAKELLADVDDPMIRTGFHNVMAHTMMLAGMYRDGERAALACLAELQQFGLEFGLAHVNLDLARGAIGLKRYPDAAALLSETRSTTGGTVFTRLACDAQLTRIAVLRGGEPQPLPARTPRTDVNSYAETLATQALYEAVRGSPAKTASLCRRANHLSHSAEVRVLTGWATATASLALRETNANRHVRSALRRAARTGIADSLVVAYRSAPQLLDVMRAVASEDERDFLVRVMARADDRLLAQAHDLEQATEVARLTPRETEVLQLVAAGYSNRRIANELFISLSTAKVHVRHIMEKLDARSRTEAAMKGLGLAASAPTQTATDTDGGGANATTRPSR